MSHDSLQFADLSKVFPAPEAKMKPIPMQSSGTVTARILLANNDPVFALALFPSLVQAGYEVVVTESGNDAIAELRNAVHPPVAIIDRNLPGMDAMEICQRMRDADKNIYLILIEDNATTPSVVAGLEGGADLYLSKSVPPEELLSYVKVGLRATNRQRTAASGV